MAMVWTALFVLATLIFVNGFSTVVSAKIQSFFTVVKVIALVAIISTGVYAVTQGKALTFIVSSGLMT